MLRRPDPVRLDALQARLRHFFKDRSLLERSLTHPSAAVESGWTAEASYERLEFLGDSLLNAWVAQLLFDRFPREGEGVLSKLRAFWVSGPVLAEQARALGLPECLSVGEGGARDGVARQIRVQASTFEALLAALHLDAGGRRAPNLVRDLWLGPVTKRGLAVLQEDAKTTLQEKMQGEGKALPSYRCEPGEEGFRAEVFLGGLLAGKGNGPTKRAAEQDAARHALELLGSDVKSRPRTAVNTNPARKVGKGRRKR